MTAEERERLLLEMVRVKVRSLTPADPPDERCYWLEALELLETGARPQVALEAST